MKNFTYYRPKTSAEAVALLDGKWGTSELLAGGTDLHDLQKQYVAQPDKVVSLNAAEKLRGISEGDGGLTIGAIYALIAIGYTMVYGIIELINFAHGDVFTLSAFYAIFLTQFGHTFPNAPDPGERVRVKPLAVRCEPGFLVLEGGV